MSNDPAMRLDDTGKADPAMAGQAAPAAMAELAQRFDWATTSLGHYADWPQSLRTTFALMLDSPQAMCLSWGPDLTFLYNDAYAPFLGRKHPNALGRPMAEVWADVWDEIAPLVDRALAGEAVRFEELSLVLQRNGYDEETWWTFCYSPARDDAGTIVGMLNVATDATSGVLARRETAAERERQRQMLQQMPGFAAMLSGPEHRFTYVNDAYVTLAGSRTFVGRTVREVFPDLGEQRFFALLDEVYRTGRPFAARAIPVQMEGEFGHRVIDLLYQPVRDDAGGVSGIFVGGYDITGQVMAEAGQRSSELRYRHLFETISSGFCIIELKFDATGRAVDYLLVEANPAFERQTGLVDVSGRWVSDFAPEVEAYWFDIYGRVATTGEAALFESAEPVFGRWYEVHAYRTGLAGDNQVAVLFNDISERRRAELARRELNTMLEARVEERTAERNLLATIIESTDVMVLVIDLSYTILALNRANADEFERIYDVRPKVGDNLLDLLAHLPSEQAGVRALWGRALAGEEFTTLSQHGTVAAERPWYECKFRTLRDEAGTPVGCYQFTTDVTERVRAQDRLNETQEALRQSQKMEAMGQLTGGVAHDFNNLLTPIVGALDMLMRRGLGSERDQRLIDGALQSAERARTLVQRLLAFARRQPLQPVPVDVAALVEGMTGLIESTLGPTIDVRRTLAPGLPPARADANQLEMALLNLAVNARDAMPDGGSLRISAELRDGVAGHPTGLAPGAFVRLAVTDTGKGMDAATLARAVEPFFSTKGVGKGTGLGLSMVHGLTAQLGGGLSIDSTPDEGTTIELWLPVSSAATPASGALPTAARQLEGVHKRALLVDDEQFVRLTTANMLSDLGYAVSEAGSAAEAIALLATDPDFALLVTDHLMPDMTGADLAQTVRQRWPDIAILIVSGYAELDAVAPDLPRLAKPFRSTDLVDALAALG